MHSPGGTWSLSEPQTIAVGTIMEPVTRMLPVNNALWCATQNCVKIVNVSTLAIEVTRSSSVKRLFIFSRFGFVPGRVRGEFRLAEIRAEHGQQRARRLGGDAGIGRRPPVPRSDSRMYM